MKSTLMSNNLEQKHIHWSIYQTPTQREVEHDIGHLKIGKGPSPNSIPPEILKYVRQETTKWIHRVLINI